MIKLQEIVGLPTLQYHLDNKLTLSECIYRYSSDSFIQLFAEARQALRDGKITLNEQDMLLLETTDIGEYGIYEGQKKALDLPMVEEEEYERRPDIKPLPHEELHGYASETTPEGEHEVWAIYFDPKTNTYNYRHRVSQDTVFGKNAKIKGGNVDEAEYRGKDVRLNKPKRGGSKKFVVYVKDPKSKNIRKVSFGGTTGLNVKIDEPGARSSFAARHQCDKKKDKTKPGYWACNIGRYWKSLGGSRNFSGYW
jgi:hypothetical protein